MAWSDWGGEPNVTHHRDFVFHHPPHQGRPLDSPLDLHRLGPRLEEGDGCLHRPHRVPVVRAEGHVPDQERLTHPAMDRPHCCQHLIQSDREGVLIAQGGAGEAITHQHQVQAGGIDQPAGGIVVRGQGGDLFATLLGTDQGNRQFLFHPVSVVTVVPWLLSVSPG